MALPFNLVAVFIFLTLQPPHFQQVPGPETEADLNTTLSWPDVGRGVIVSMGQVYAVNELEPSLLINLAVLLSSPLLFVMANIGAALGTLLSLAFIEISEYDQVNQSFRCLLSKQLMISVVRWYLGLQLPAQYGGCLLCLLPPHSLIIPSRHRQCDGHGLYPESPSTEHVNSKIFNFRQNKIF